MADEICEMKATSHNYINVIAGSDLNFNIIFHLELQFVGQSAAVGLDLSLRCIFKPSYSRHCICTDVCLELSPVVRTRMLYKRWKTLIKHL